MKTNISIITILSLVLSFLNCSDSSPLKPNPNQNIYKITDSFETDLSDWEFHALDNFVNDVPIEWYIEKSDEQVSQGQYSAKLFVDNITDAAKVWMEQSIDVEPNKTYTVTIKFDFGTIDYGQINLFVLLGNILNEKPLTRDDVLKGYLQDGDFPELTYNGGIQDWVWLEKSLTKTVTSTAEGKLYFILGTWGTWEGPRTYYFDDLKVTVVEQS